MRRRARRPPARRKRERQVSRLMGKITGFIELQRIAEVGGSGQRARAPLPRVHPTLARRQAPRRQGARCMDCGIPFCQSGCPVNNIIPDWNDLVYRQQWRDALDVLHSTNNFPGVHRPHLPGAVRSRVHAQHQRRSGRHQVDRALHHRQAAGKKAGSLPQPPRRQDRQARRRRRLGPGGPGVRAAARARGPRRRRSSRRPIASAGCLRYGIPDFKMEKHLIDRRMAQMSIEGVEFRPGVACRRANVVGRGASLAEFDAVVARPAGAEAPRDLPVPGRDLAGVHFAMEFLPQQNQRRRRRRGARQIIATGKHVIVIGGGDTGSGLRRHVESPGRAVGHAVRAAAATARAGEQAARVAVLADQAAHVVVARGRLRARLGGRDQAVRRHGTAQVEKLVAARVEWQQDGDGQCGWSRSRAASSR